MTIKATKTNAEYTSIILEQEAIDGDWTDHTPSMTADFKKLGIINTSTQTQLDISDNIGAGSELIIHDGTSFKQGTIGTPTYNAELVPADTMNNATYTGDSENLKSGVSVTSTMSYANDSLNLSGVDTNIHGLEFKPDGSEFYFIDFYSWRVVQVSLTTPWDISSANNLFTAPSYAFYADTGSGETQPRSLAFSDDGTRMFVSGDTTDAIHQWVLGTAWDVTSSSYAGSFNPSAQMSFHRTFCLGDNGTRLYIFEFNDIFEYSLGTAWDVTTATFVNSVAGMSDVQQCYDAHIDTTGTVITFMNRDQGYIYQYRLDTPWDITSTSQFKKIAQEQLGSSGSVPSDPITAPRLTGFAWSADGLQFFVQNGAGGGPSENYMYAYDVTYPFRVSTSTVVNPANDFKTLRLV